MRPAAVLALLLVLGVATPAVAEGPLALAFSVFPEAGAGQPFPAWGQVTTRDPAGLARPVPGQRVSVYLDGALAATTLTTLQGGFRVDPVAPQAGPHVLHAVVDEGTPAAARSGDVHMKAVTRPGAPRDLEARTGATWNVVEVSWSPPADTGGGTLQGYTLHRLGGGSTMGTFVAGTSFTDDVRKPGPYEYRVTPRNAAGDGPATSAAYAPPPRPLSVIAAAVTLRVCDAQGACTDGVNDTREASRSGTYDLSALIRGRATSDGVPLGGEPIFLRADVTSPEDERWDFRNVVSASNGTFQGWVDLGPFLPDGSRVAVVPEARSATDGGLWVGDEVFVEVHPREPCIVC